MIQFLLNCDNICHDTTLVNVVGFINTHATLVLKFCDAYFVSTKYQNVQVAFKYLLLLLLYLICDNRIPTTLQLLLNNDQI